MKYSFKNKNVLVYGMSISGVWASRLLSKQKANVFIFDDNQEKLLGLGLKKCKLVQSVDESLLESIDYIIVSPSITKENKVVCFAESKNIPVLSELEFASLFCKNYVAVTGTNGKTTTVELISAILNTSKKAIACGNIGYPLSKAVLNNKNSIKVCEVSSFMLENCKSFAPKVASVLNIEPDHLVRHKTMQEYESLKLSIFKNQKTTDYAVVNLDNKINVSTDATKITYSYSHNADVRVKDGAIYLRQTKIVNLNEIPLKGKHNVYNVMCAVCFAYILGIKQQLIRKGILNFKPDRFRNQHIATINGINFINDSKSTNIASTIASISATKGAIILLLGGSNKMLDYSQLFSNLTKRVKNIVAFGEIAELISKANNNIFSLEICKNLSTAFDAAVNKAKRNDTILLSPSSASYDEFSSYIERGLKFNEKVKEYEVSQSQR